MPKQYQQVISSDELDIYAEEKVNNNIIYHLTLHGTTKKIGYIRITYSSNITMYGNIGYEIYDRYQGHNYTYKALLLLENEMLNRGLSSPIITVLPNNLASIRVIEKLGGEFIGEEYAGSTYYKYKINLSKKKDEEVKQKRKHL